MKQNILHDKSIELLKQLIATPSFSREEEKTGTLLFNFLEAEGIKTERYLNNIWAVNKYFDPSKNTILLNSHHDTVKPNPQYTKDPFNPEISEGKLFGLGSNDAGGCLVSLIAAFVHFYPEENLLYNLALAATAEEEVSGKDGIEALLINSDFASTFKDSGFAGAIVGEPTQMNLAIAEKGLMVLDCTAFGKAGHAAREEGDNALYKAINDIEWFRTYSFDKVSEWLGPVKMSVTSIETENRAHNVVPGTCKFVVDIRITEDYTHDDILEIIQQHVKSEVKPRSIRMRSTLIPEDHPIVKAGISLGKKAYGSPTSSDKALMPFPALKCGPGFSGRSHTADEFIFIDEIKQGIDDYIGVLNGVMRSPE
ncbi:MAG: acetylornithine deacetylase [Chitinophagaceae bacterium]|nr:acetylornithine deacetylase [Chitinophagaceae bacterium]